MNTRAFPLKRLFQGCLVHWVNIANYTYYSPPLRGIVVYYFAKELNVSEE